MGKRFSGKSVLSDMLSKNHNLVVIRVPDLVTEAIEAFNKKETVVVRTVVTPKCTKIEEEQDEDRLDEDSTGNQTPKRKEAILRPRLNRPMKVL